MVWLMILFAILALAAGIWIGVGAPGWPHKPPQGGKRRKLEKRSINPVQWGRGGADRHTDRRNRRGR